MCVRSLHGAQAEEHKLGDAAGCRRLERGLGEVLLGKYRGKREAGNGENGEDEDGDGEVRLGKGWGKMRMAAERMGEGEGDMRKLMMKMER